MDQHRSGDTTTPCIALAVGKRDIVGNNYNLHQDAFRTRPLGSESEVDAISGVVLHNEENTRISGIIRCPVSE